MTSFQDLWSDYNDTSSLQRISCDWSILRLPDEKLKKNIFFTGHTFYKLISLFHEKVELFIILVILEAVS